MAENTWKVIYVASRQEKKLAQRLTEAGVEVYLPIHRSLRQWSDRKKWVDMPLFNGYLFVRPTLKQRDTVLQQQGALAYLRFNGEDAKVSEEEIQIIRNIIQSGYSLEQIHKPEDFSSGDKAVVTEGPLRGLEVEVMQQNSEEIFMVCFDTFGQNVRITLPYHILRKK